MSSSSISHLNLQNNINLNSSTLKLTFGHRLKKAIFGTDPTVRNIEQIIAQLSSDKISCVEDKNAQSNLDINNLATCFLNLSSKKVSRIHLSWINSQLKEILNQHLNKQEIDNLINNLIRRKYLDGQSAPLDACLGMISLDRLERHISDKKEGDIAQLKDLKNIALQTLKFAPSNEKMTEQVKKQSLSYLKWISHSFRYVAKLYMKANEFSLDEPEPSSSWEASSRLYHLTELTSKVGLFGIWMIEKMTAMSQTKWFKYVIPPFILGVPLTLSQLYKNWFNTTPARLHYKWIINLTDEAKKGGQAEVIGRESELKALVNSLGEIGPRSLCPILLGKTGVGKTELIKGLAADIAQGKYPSLKNKTVFMINTADLLSGMGNWENGEHQTRLESVISDIRGHEHEIILFLDEIHEALKNVSSGGSEIPGTMGGQLKSLISSGKVHIIGATTKKEFEKYFNTVDAEPILRRLHKIDLNELDPKTTEAVLKHTVIKDYPNVIVDRQAITKTIELTNDPGYKPNSSQPSKARELLSLAIESQRQNCFEEEDRIAELQNQQNRARLKYQLGNDLTLYSKRGKKLMKAIETRGKEITRLQNIVSRKKAVLQEYQELKAKKVKLKNDFFNIARIVANGNQLNQIGDVNDASKKFLAIPHFLLKELDVLLEEKEQWLSKQGINVRISVDVINKTFQKLT